jgi:protein SCO1/2
MRGALQRCVVLVALVMAGFARAEQRPDFQRGVPSPAQTTGKAEMNPARLTFDQNLGAQLSLQREFVDESGHRVRLADCFGSGPVILTLGYYQCPMLCNLVLNGIVQSLQEIKETGEGEATLVFISIDPSERPELALAKKLTYLKRFGRAGAESRWHFLTGRSGNAERVASEIGFHYAYDPTSKLYAHPSGIVVLTPGGKVSQYFFGVSYSARELSAALKQAGQEIAGTKRTPLLMLCSKFMALTGRHSGAVMLAVRSLAVLSVIAVAGLVLAQGRRRKGGAG